ncbi:SRPBCC domain-containing protein [Frankia sp. Cas4]|uniref:SRPBCC domain-containing protein n=1 Tax=Frankia sp. Cas4 TaxID=3073927 RepID=UPI002AD24CAB|nr:SRPBCC domain-containing protein [Frankia sp. Cas4]
MTTTTPPATQTYHVFIRATPQQVWDAITTPTLSAGYLFGALVETTGEVGTPFRYHSPDRCALWGDETVLDADAPHRLVVTYRALYNPDLANEPPSRVTWQITSDENHVSLLTVVHDHLDNSPDTAARVANTGWMRVLSGFKTLLETGTPLSVG